MNTKSLILALAAIAPVSAKAESPRPTVSLIVNCAYAEWPTRDEVARHLRIPVVTVGEMEPTPSGLSARASVAQAKEEVRQLQRFIRREGRRECGLGASHVQVDFNAPQGQRVAVVAVAGGR